MKNLFLIFSLVALSSFLNAQSDYSSNVENEAGETLESWQLSAGSFITASDVTAHNQLGQDLADIVDAAQNENWSEALNIYTFGKNFPWKGTTHSFGRFADNYNNKIAWALPESVELLTTPYFMDIFLSSALAGTGQFSSAESSERQAALEAGLLATTLNWCRFELATAHAKATAEEPNWSLKNGAPKNWNEIFAFFYGPDGNSSLYQVLMATPEGEAINEQIFDTLTTGQDALLQEQWPEEEALKITELLNAASLALVDAALAEEDSNLARAKLKGYWLAAIESYAAVDSSSIQALHEQVMAADTEWETLQDSLAN